MSEVEPGQPTVTDAHSGARTWTAEDPEPEPWPTVVDEDGVTWRPVDEDGLGYLTYHQQQIVHHGTFATCGQLTSNWRNLWDHLTEGSTVREATAEEAQTWIETWPSSGHPVNATTEPTAHTVDHRAEVDALPERSEDRICEAIGAAVSEAIATGQFAEHLAGHGWHLVRDSSEPPTPPAQWLHDGLDVTEHGWIDPLGRLGELWCTAWTAGHEAGQIDRPEVPR